MSPEPGAPSRPAGRDTAIAWAFVAVQLGLLAVILLVPSGDDWAVPTWLADAARVLQWVGLVVLAIGLVNLGRSLTALPTPVEHGTLKTGGLFRFARHPIYSGIMALVVGSAVRSANVISAVATVALIGWFMLKARWEEGKLAARYPGYRAYAERTPRFVPGWPFGADRQVEVDHVADVGSLDAVVEVRLAGAVVRPALAFVEAAGSGVRLEGPEAGAVVAALAEQLGGAGRAARWPRPSPTRSDRRTTPSPPRSRSRAGRFGTARSTRSRRWSRCVRRPRGARPSRRRAG